MGTQSGRSHKRVGPAGSGDQRWRKAKKARQKMKAELHGLDAPTAELGSNGDTKGIEVSGESPEEPPTDNMGTELDTKRGHNGEDNNDRLLAKKRGKHAAVKERKRRKYEELRQAADTEMRSSPASLLWRKYASWAGEKLSPLERDTEQWSSENVASLFVSCDKSTYMPCNGATIAALKAQYPHVYAKNTSVSDGTPSVSVLLLAPSGLRASQLAGSLFDGKSVGKLFSKHITQDSQAEWLRKHGTPKAARTAAGTARRVQLLCESGDLSLGACTAILLDMHRDVKMQNILDMTSTEGELFQLIHDFARPLIKSGQLRIFLVHSTREGERDHGSHANEGAPKL